MKKRNLNSINQNQSDTKFTIVIDNDNSNTTNEPMITNETENKPKEKISIFSRLGNTSNKDILSGTTLIIDNLNRSVTKEDIKDLCESVGEIKSVNITYNKTSNNQTAEIVFSRRSVALECITKFHNVKLDGTPMIVKLKGENGKENPFNPSIVSEAVAKENNVRVGLFGTAIDGEGDYDEPTDKVIITTSSKGRVVKTVNSNPFESDDYYEGHGFLDRSKPFKRIRPNQDTFKSINTSKKDFKKRIPTKGRKEVTKVKRDNPVSTDDLDDALSNYMSGKK